MAFISDSDVVRAVACHEVGHAARGDLAGGELAADVAQHAARHAHVAVDHAEQRGVGLAALVQLQRRDAQALGIDLGAVRGIGARHAPADIGVMADRRGIGDRLGVLRACGEQRLEDEDVRQVHPAVIRVVVDQDVALGDVVAEMPQHRLERDRDRAEMAGQCKALCRKPPLRVAQRGAVVHDVLQHPGIGGAVDRQHHLVAQCGDGVAEQLFGDRVGCVHGGHGTTEGGRGQPVGGQA